MALLSVRGRGPFEILLRLAGLVLVMGLAVFGFWKNSERNVERLNEQAAMRAGLDDATGGLDQDGRARVRGFITTMNAAYGIQARVRISRAAPVAPPPDGKTLFIGLAPELGVAVVRLPPLVERSLGPDFARGLETEHFPFHFAPGRSWQKGLNLALDLIENRLAALTAPPDDNKEKP